MKKEDAPTNDVSLLFNHRDGFLLTEYGMLMEMRRDALNLQERRLNAFLVISGGAVAALGLAAQVKNEAVLTYQYLLPFVLGIMTFSIFLFGRITFERMILRAAEINIISKAMQSIREYYI